MEYKPLSELAKDEESSNLIFELLTGEDVSFGIVKDVPEYQFFTLWEDKPSYYDDAEPLHHIHIQYDGTVSWLKGDMMIDFNVFALVDFIRSLGYSA